MTNINKQGRKTDGLLKFRLVVYTLALAHLVIMTVRLLGKDFEHSEDIAVRVYAKFKWKLITTWFNLLSYGYIPVCLYCDWQTLTGSEREDLKILKGIRDFTFTNVLLPTTAFADILFWRLWCHNKELLFPPSVETVIHVWEHHSMHTVSLAFVVFDLIFVRRERPKSMLPGIVATLSFASLYSAVCVHSVVNEEYLYPVFARLSPYKLLVLAIYTYVSLLFYQTGQWLIVDLIHYGQRVISKKIV